MANRSRITDDNLLLARIAGTVSRLATWSMSADREAAAVTELRQLAGHRPDLLAHEAGLALSHAGSGTDGQLHQVRADLWIKAGADVSKIPEWIEIGRARAAVAAAIPYTGSMHRR